MTKRRNTRRRFLAASSATALAAAAGCTDVLSNDGDGNGGNESGGNGGNSSNESSGNGDSDEYDSPELTVETEYNSREEFRQPGDQLDDFESADDWELLQGQAEVDEDVTFEGDQSLRLMAENEGNVAVATDLDEATDMEDLDVSLAVRTTTPADIALEIQLRDIYGGHASYSLREITYGTDNVGWFRICPGFFSESTTPVEQNSIEEIRIIVHNTGAEAEVWVDDLRTHEKPDQGYVILNWDDGYQDFYDPAASLHDEYDVTAVASVVRQWVRGQREGIMTIDQLQERQEAGDQIVAHGTHTQLTELSDSELEDTLNTDKNWAVNAELEGGNYLVFPHNNFDARVLDVATNYYYAGGFNQSGSPNLTGVHGFDPMVLPRTIGYDLDTAMTCVDIAAEHRQCTVLNFHQFELENTMGVDDYEELLQYIADTDGVEAIDFDDLWTMRRNGH
ncbi:polysaccharide deacetylase family protein [Natronococcus sp. JC468]|uniref:polysaccharide deacetylase family protein n=1 Tax=Natronococcus sp. JC468 TaxID=1961921 RepID=UPI00143ABD2C|nr:polysaccharide deacetylase family protein [Natronococcus sp. JC468]NKE34532.1 polysaccharide deacetylase family protein [Natronococcus sp. JC468]